MDLRRRMGALVILCLVAIVILEIPAILFSYRLSQENRGFSGFSKTTCSVIDASTEDSVCQLCFNGGCIDQPCFTPTFTVHASHLANEKLVIRTQGKPKLSDAESDLRLYKPGRSYSCLYASADPAVVRFGPRGYSAYVAAVTISWLLIIIAVILCIFSCYSKQ